MPDKINPVMTEMATEVAYQVIACDQAITLGAFSGQMELNAFLPLVTFNLITELKLLINATALFRTYCIEGIEANIEHCERWLEESRCLATALAPYIGHEKAGEISRQAKQDGKTIREVVLSRGMFTEEELNIIFSAQELTRPGIAGQRKLKQMKEKK